MSRFRPFLNAIAALAVIAALTSVQSAYALDQELQITVDGFLTTFTAPNGGSASTGGNILFHGVTINANISDNNPGTPSLGFLQGSTVTLRDSDGLSHTVKISVGDTNWNNPTGTLTAVSSLGGTSTATGASGLSLTSYVDQANGQNSQAGTTLGPVSTYQSGNINSGGGAAFALNTATAGITGLHSPFSMTSVVNVSLSASAIVNFTSNLALTPVPEPSTMALTGLGALGFVGYGLRRRKAKGA